MAIRSPAARSGELGDTGSAVARSSSRATCVGVIRTGVWYGVARANVSRSGTKHRGAVRCR